MAKVFRLIYVLYVFPIRSLESCIIYLFMYTLIMQSMKNVVADCVAQLKRVFRDGIEERCRAGANKAKTAAVETSDTFAASMHWASYRASMYHSSFARSVLN